MSRDYFDICVIIPLEEELIEFQKFFPALENRSSPIQFRYVVDSGSEHLKVLVVQQQGMGKGYASRAVHDALVDVDIGLVACLGIAGALSSDLKLGDVCYTGAVIDVYDNAKATDGQSGEIDIDFSPNHFKTSQEITSALNYIRTMPELRPQYEQWREERGRFAEQLIDRPIRTASGNEYAVSHPDTMSGTIVCGVVSQSNAYKKKLFALDRKVLAIETESGGIFEAALTKGLPALIVRGISDPADSDKNALERQAKGKVRQIAAANAASFLRMQFSNNYFVNYLIERRNRRLGIEGKSNSLLPIDGAHIASAISDVAQGIDAKLRELSPEYRLQPQGYRLPIPRIKGVNYTSGVDESIESDPVELRDAIQDRSTLVIHVPRNYPDQSLPWIFAADLLSAEFSNKQIVPIVVDGDEIRPPKGTLASAMQTQMTSAEFDATVQLVFIIDKPPLASATRLKFIIEQIKAVPSAKFVLITRSDLNIVQESGFIESISAHMFSLCDVSFVEIAHFIQKNFSMSGSEAEVIALRLRNTFSKFDLDAHPTYFAGIPRETLAALLQANRRAELIQLAVDGFLSFVVAEDTADVALSRTSRSQFLRSLVVAIKLEKKSFTQAQLIDFVKGFAVEYDFDIDPLTFLYSFIDKGILHFEADEVRFSLPFIESYLLAVELSGRSELALKYFDLADAEFDLPAFDLYAEIGASSEFIDVVVLKLKACLLDLEAAIGQEHILFTDRVRPNLLGEPTRLKALQDRLRRAAKDVLSNREDKEQKQRILDIADHIREKAASQRDQEQELDDKAATGDSSEDSDTFRDFEILDKVVPVWAIATVLLGSGAERIDAQTKQTLVRLLIKLASGIMDIWSRANGLVDFQEIKKEMTKPETLELFSNKQNPDEKEEDLRRLVSGLVDMLEYAFLSQPIRRTIHHLCEQARSRVLAASIARSGNYKDIEAVIYGAWLADVDAKRGQAPLKSAVKNLPAAPFFRITLATHLLSRVYWSHWKKEDRLILLEAAEESIKPLQVTLDKPALKRLIEKTADGNVDGAE